MFTQDISEELSKKIQMLQKHQIDSQRLQHPSTPERTFIACYEKTLGTDEYKIEGKYTTFFECPHTRLK